MKTQTTISGKLISIGGVNPRLVVEIWQGQDIVIPVHRKDLAAISMNYLYQDVEVDVTLGALRLPAFAAIRLIEKGGEA